MMKKENPSKKGVRAASLWAVLKNNGFILRIALREAPLYAAFLLLDMVKHQVVLFIEHVYMISYIIDCIQYERPFSHALAFIGAVFVFVCIVHCATDYLEIRTQPRGKEKVVRALRRALYEKAAQTDLRCYDDPAFYNDFVWALGDVPGQVEKTMKNAGGFLGALCGIAITSGYILLHDRAGLLLAVISLSLTLLFGDRLNRLQFKLETLLKPLQRKRDYINRVFYLSDYAKEIRLSRVKDKLLKDFERQNQEIKDTIKKHTRGVVVYTWLLEYISNFFIFDCVYLLYLLFRTLVQHSISYGSMVALYKSLSLLKENMTDLSKILPVFQAQSLYIDKIRSFLRYERKVISPPHAQLVPEGGGDLELRHVSFRYDAQGEDVLHDISLTVHQGEKIALVGYNGAGKTTLVKLIMRLYDPTQGEITYGSQDIRRYDLESYRHSIGTVFQDYQLYAAALAENVTMDSGPYDPARVREALDSSGFAPRMAGMPQGLQTQLTKEFDNDGQNLSGGEQQKVAISRALYKDSRLIILDEPSSALDPIAEYHLNDTMRRLPGGKSVIMISHRLSTTKMADRIYMLEHGRIIEQGTHEELMRRRGAYARMFLLQAEKYR